MRWLGTALMLAVLGLARAGLAQEVTLELLVGKDPDRFLSRMTDLIAGFGGPQGLTAAGIEEHIALERAAARASALRRFLAMDLDADGAVDRAELAVSQRAASASSRGRLERLFIAADADGDGQVAPVEIAAQGSDAGLRALEEDEAEALRGLMALDRNGDSALTPDEVAAAVALADPAG
jgi:hypothetical protein